MPSYFSVPGEGILAIREQLTLFQRWQRDRHLEPGCLASLSWITQLRCFSDLFHCPKPTALLFFLKNVTQTVDHIMRFWDTCLQSHCLLWSYFEACLQELPTNQNDIADTCVEHAALWCLLEGTLPTPPGAVVTCEEGEATHPWLFQVTRWARDAHHRQAKGCQHGLVIISRLRDSVLHSCNQHWWRSDMAQCCDRHLDTQSCCVDSASGEHKESNTLPNVVTHCRNSCLQHPTGLAYYQEKTRGW